MRLFKAIFYVKMQFTMLFSGLQLLVTWFPIFGQSPAHRNALIRQKCGNGSHFLHKVPKMAKLGLCKAIFDVKMQFTMLFSGLQLLVSWFPILGQSPGLRNALIRNKFGNGSHFCKQDTQKWPFFGLKWPKNGPKWSNVLFFFHCTSSTMRM